MNAKNYLTLQTEDSNGDVPDMSLLLSNYRHKKGGIYTPALFVWNATTDQWNIMYKDVERPVIPFTRTLDDFKTPGRFFKHNV